MSSHTVVNGQSVENLPSYDEIVNLTALYQTEGALHAQDSEDRFFPSVRFTHNGSIIGWRFPAAPGGGTGRPTLSILRLMSGSSYKRVSQTLLDDCIVSSYQLGDGSGIELHQSGPASPIPFQEGDIFGLHLRRDRVAHFVPYLYNSTLVGERENLSYYLPRAAIRDGEVILDTISSDTLQPLFALTTCKSFTVSVDSPVHVCHWCCGGFLQVQTMTLIVWPWVYHSVMDRLSSETSRVVKLLAPLLLLLRLPLQSGLSY